VKDLKGKVVVVTGAASGIGRALASALNREGALLALADRDGQGLSATVEALTAAGISEQFTVDVSKRDQVYQFAEDTVKAFGHVDVVINNAGVSSSGFVQGLTYETLQWTIDINLWGTIYGTKAFLPLLMERPEANLVNVSSVYGLIGVPGQAAYCASKFAVRGFTEALRQELYGSRVAVTIVFPGGIRTNIARNSRTDYQVDRQTFEAGVKKFEEGLKTSPEEAARAIVEGIRRNAPRVLIGKDAKEIDFLARFRPNTYDGVIARHLKRGR
jgi:NAD(P)-dependent dehydrogenase (short-subunit alcohol dehydrogenase family)